MLKPLIQLKKIKIYNIQTYQHIIEHLGAKTELIALWLGLEKDRAFFINSECSTVRGVEIIKKGDCCYECGNVSAGLVGTTSRA